MMMIIIIIRRRRRTPTITIIIMMMMMVMVVVVVVAAVVFVEGFLFVEDATFFGGFLVEKLVVDGAFFPGDFLLLAIEGKEEHLGLLGRVLGGG